MALPIVPIVGGLFSIASTVIERLIPDPAKQAEAKLALLEMEQKGELAQLAVNLQEAKHESLFVAGWRPFIGWVCGSALAYNYIAQPFLVFMVTAFAWELPPLPSLDLPTLTTVLMGMLGLGALRTFEKYTHSNTHR